MIFHITKTIVGFLNEKGGIMYIGISEDKTKKVTVAGITLSMNELKEVFEFFTSKIVK